MTVSYPESVPTLGNIKVIAVTAVASLTAPSLATEVGAGTSVEMSGAFMASGWSPATTQGKTTKQRRLASTSDTEILTPALHQVGTLMWSNGDPQSPDTDIDGIMVEGALIYWIERLGVDADTAFAASDEVVTHYLRLGKPYRVYDPTADNGEFYMAAEAVYANEGPVDGTLAA